MFFRSQWPHSFLRITILVREVIWSYLDLFSLLKTCGTASDPPKTKVAPDQAFLPNFDKAFYGTECV